MDNWDEQKAQAEGLSAAEAQVDPALSEPAPADLEVDRELMNRRIQVELMHAPAEIRDDWLAGRLSLALSGFDAQGWGWISVFRDADGVELGAVRVHWSALVAR